MIKDRYSIEAPIVRADDGYFKRIHVEEGTSSLITETQNVDIYGGLPELNMDVTSQVRSLQISPYLVPQGKISSIGLLNAKSGLSGDSLYLAVYENKDNNWSLVAISKNAVAQTDFGINDFVAWEFDPEELSSLGEHTIRLNWCTTKEEATPIWAFPASNKKLNLQLHTGSIGGALTQAAASGGAWWPNSPLVRFVTEQTVVITGAPVFRTPALLGQSPVTGVSVDEGIRLQGKTCFIADDATYGVDSDDFINNIATYDNVVPTVRMIRLMLQNQARLAAIQEETPITPVPVSTMEAPVPIPIAVAAAPAQYAFPLITTETKEIDVTPISTKTKNDKPRKRKKSNSSI